MVGNQKTANMTIRLDKSLLSDYKSLCERQGFDMSKRIRIFLEKEIEFDKRGENILNKLG